MSALNIFSGILGVLILVTVLGDVVKTTLSAKGSGFISGAVANTLWSGALGWHRRHSSHELLSFMGTFILVAIIGVWTFLLWVGWSLFFSTDPGSTVWASDDRPTSTLETFYFIGYTLITLGSGEIRPQGPFWQIATLAATTTGFVVLTLSITFLLSILPAVAAKRQTASYITSLGLESKDIVLNHWNGEDCQALVDHLPNLATSLSTLIQTYQAFPVIHYFHSTNPHTAFPLRLAALNDALGYLSHGVSGGQETAARLRPLQVLIADLLSALEDGFIDPSDDAPPPPPLAPLTQNGIATVSQKAFDEAAGVQLERRKLLLGFIEKDGWQWEDMQKGAPKPG